MFNKFLDYTEIKTKITSIFAFLMTIAYLYYLEEPIEWNLTALFFASMFLFDLTTTAINNYIDTKTNHQVLPYERKKAKSIIYALFGTSAAFGLLLVYYTDLVVFLVGGLCFLVGVFYTYGPIPISRQPWGELLSGLFYGLFIPFLILYINLPEGTLVTLDLTRSQIDVQFMVGPLVSLLLLSVHPVCTTANIMLANNICDVEKDIRDKRFTLPYYLEEKALPLFAIIYYATYGSTILLVVLQVLSPISLLSLLTIFPVTKNIKVFLKEQKKETTFIISIRNFILIMGAFTASIFISALLT